MGTAMRGSPVLRQEKVAEAPERRSEASAAGSSWGRRKLTALVWPTAIALFFVGGSASTMACSPCSVHGQAAIEFLGGETNESRTVYQTGEPQGEMLYFPEGRRYDLVHGLGVTPASVDLYVSFRRELTDPNEASDKTEPNNVSPSAGNQAVIEVWNDRIIRVRNDTCAEFYLRAVATADPDEVAALGGAGGASGQ